MKHLGVNKRKKQNKNRIRHNKGGHKVSLKTAERNTYILQHHIKIYQIGGNWKLLGLVILQAKGKITANPYAPPPPLKMTNFVAKAKFLQRNISNLLSQSQTLKSTQRIYPLNVLSFQLHVFWPNTIKDVQWLAPKGLFLQFVKQCANCMNSSH